MQFIRCLQKAGVDDSRIIYLNLESIDAEHIHNYTDLNQFVRENVPRTDRTYIFLDEIQRVDGWERTINSLMVDFDADLYITGSNAHMLSSDLSTFLSGRYIELNILPLSFKEYVQLHPIDAEHTRHSRFMDYIWMGSMPRSDPALGQDFVTDYLLGIYNTVLTRDIQTRVKTRDTTMLENICRFLMSNIGNVTSGNSIAKNAGISPTVTREYLRALEDAYIVYKVYRYDMIGKRILSTTEKYYVSDTGIRNSVLGNAKGTDISRQIENIVYLELRRRGYTVTVGSYRDLEIDFTAATRDTIEYYQVTQTLLGEEAYNREMRSLRSAKDNFPKMILSLDEIVTRPADGILHRNLIEWLLDAPY